MLKKCKDLSANQSWAESTREQAVTSGSQQYATAFSTPPATIQGRAQTIMSRQSYNAPLQDKELNCSASNAELLQWLTMLNSSTIHSC